MLLIRWHRFNSFAYFCRIGLSIYLALSRGKQGGIYPLLLVADFGLVLLCVSPCLFPQWKGLALIQSKERNAQSVMPRRDVTLLHLTQSQGPEGRKSVLVVTLGASHLAKGPAHFWQFLLCLKERGKAVQRRDVVWLCSTWGALEHLGQLRQTSETLARRMIMVSQPLSETIIPGSL